MSLRLSCLALALSLFTDIALAQEAAPALPAITVAEIAPASLTDRAYVSGLIQPVERVLVQPQIEGQAVVELTVEVGDRVEAGEVLARLSDTALTLQASQAEASRASAAAGIAQARAQLAEAEAVRDEATRARDRAVSLADQGSGPRATADDAGASAAAAAARVAAAGEALKASQAQLTLVEAQAADVALQLSRTEVRAPVAGNILERNAMIGGIASAGSDPMFAIMRDGALELRADVAERDLLRLAPGQTVRMRVVGLDTPQTGRVRLVEPVVDDVSRLGRVRILLDRPEAVRAGMFAAAEVIVATREALAAPVSALGGDAAASSVLRVENGTVARVEVATGIRDGGLIEIRDGLDAGDTVVAKAGAFVRDGDRINPILAAADTAVLN